MSQPLFILKSKTQYQDSSKQIRIELEPISDEFSKDFWADPDNPSGRCEFYIAASQSVNYPIGAKFRLSILLSPV